MSNNACHYDSPAHLRARPTREKVACTLESAANGVVKGSNMHNIHEDTPHIRKYLYLAAGTDEYYELRVTTLASTTILHTYMHARRHPR